MIRRLRKRCTLIVAIGSSECRNERRNPFSGRERKVMMEIFLRESRIGDVRVVALRDGPSLRWSVDNLIRRCRPDVVFLSTERSRLATLTARKVRVARFRRSGPISGTRIRNSIAAGRQDWTRLTGKSVVQWILSHNGIARIKAAYAAPDSPDSKRLADSSA